MLLTKQSLLGVQLYIVLFEYLDSIYIRLFYK